MRRSVSAICCIRSSVVIASSPSAAVAIEPSLLFSGWLTQTIRCSHTGGDCAMSNNSTTSPALQSEAESAVHLLDDCFDPIEAGLREQVREFIQAMIREAALVRPRYGRRPKADA